jgi:hypothetical protein
MVYIAPTHNLKFSMQSYTWKVCLHNRL